MKRSRSARCFALAMGGLLILACGAMAQTAPPPAPQQGAPQTQNPTPPTDPNKPNVEGLTLDNAPPPVNAEEEAAVKAFRDLPNADVDKKDAAGEQFLQKYPESRYRAEIYNFLVKGYLNTGQVDKMEEAGDKEIALNGNDPQTLAIVGSTLPRTLNPSMTNEQKLKRLEKADQYCKRALDLLPAFVKPDYLTEEQFKQAKDQIMAMAYSGIGIVAFRRQKYTEAIPALEQSVKLDTTPDPVNYYLLGVSNEKASHFDDAVAVFTKCAAMPGPLQANCKNGVDEAKKAGATQMSAPK
jgi:tetratricopeptide (TPR) repeat protein